ncbi:hypothetical protein [Luteimonas terrae]|uniref:Uncharacterized protein n=1 Tax=Luteimonas terrae TaxID=1530191 RepID=A0ABU1Y0X8_9GAMM|nr:hypothetical protein [Luteimonas terrae]MDR7194618.1 hypothetical protein [Luteimonas terrae]
MSIRTTRIAVSRTYRGSALAATAAAVATAVQVMWSSPVALSAAEWRTSPLAYVSLLSLIAWVSTLALLALLPRRLGPGVQAGWVALTMAGYWLLLNYVDFVLRVAAWSTFERSSILLHVLRASALPVAVCAAALVALLPRLLTRSRR